ncbi:MAG: retroviral-like aspartic protease, partial [Sphingobacteriaceae bacterium]
IRQQVIRYSEQQANNATRQNIQQQHVTSQNTQVAPQTTPVTPPVTPTAVLTKNEGKDKVQELKTSCGILESWEIPEMLSNNANELMAGGGTKIYDVTANTRSGRTLPHSEPKKKKKVTINEEIDDIDDGMDLDVDNEIEELGYEDMEESLRRIQNEDNGKKDEGASKTIRPSYIMPGHGEFKNKLERPVFADNPRVVTEVVEKLMKSVIDIQVKELCAISPVVSEEVKKWVSKRRLNINQDAMVSGVNSTVLSDFEMDTESNSSMEVNLPQAPLYSTPLGYVNINIGKIKLKALIDSGSQINIIPQRLMQVLPVQTVVNIKSAVRGIGGQKTGLCGIAEKVKVKIGRNIEGLVQYYVSEEDQTPIILGRSFLFDYGVQLDFKKDLGEMMTLKDTRGIWMKVRLCEPDKGRWERELNVELEDKQGYVVCNVTCQKELHIEEDGYVTIEDEEVYGLQFEKEYVDHDLINELSLIMCIESQEIYSRGRELRELRSFGAKYKSVEKKIKPVNAPMPQYLNYPLQRPPLSRDPYVTPLVKNPPEFKETQKTTVERLKQCNFGPAEWLSEEEWKLFLHILVLREGAVAYCEEERGLLKHSYGLPYAIPVVEHEPWQIRPIPIPVSIRNEFIDLVRQRIRTGLYEQSTSSYTSPIFCVLKGDGKLR